MTADLWAGEETVVPSGLRGYRSWNMRDGRLCSTGVAHVWDAPKVAARCLSRDVVGGLDGQDCPCDLCIRGRHAAPVKYCTCGIYGWYSPDDARLVRGHVFGVVEATGRVVLASHGFRAQGARIVALAIEPVRQTGSYTLSLYFGPEPPTTDELHALARWAKTQGIPVFATRAELLAEYPPEDVSSLIQHECDDTCQAHEGHSRRTTAGTLTISSSGAFSTYTASSGYPSMTLERSSRSRGSLAYATFFLAIAAIGFVIGLVALSPAGLIINGGLAGYWAYDLWPDRPAFLRRSSDDEPEDDA